MEQKPKPKRSLHDLLYRLTPEGYAEEAQKAETRRREEAERLRRQNLLYRELYPDEADSLITIMQRHSSRHPVNLDLTLSNWKAQFGETGAVESPLGTVKMTQKQVIKLFFGKISLCRLRPTLQQPDVILKEDASVRMLYFIRAFRKGEDYLYAVIPVKEQTMEVFLKESFTGTEGLHNMLTTLSVAYMRKDLLPLDLTQHPVTESSPKTAKAKPAEKPPAATTPVEPKDEPETNPEPEPTKDAAPKQDSLPSEAPSPQTPSRPQPPKPDTQPTGWVPKALVASFPPSPRTAPQEESPAHRTEEEDIEQMTLAMDYDEYAMQRRRELGLPPYPMLRMPSFDRSLIHPDTASNLPSDFARQVEAAPLAARPTQTLHDNPYYKMIRAYHTKDHRWIFAVILKVHFSRHLFKMIMRETKLYPDVRYSSFREGWFCFTNEDWAKQWTDDMIRRYVALDTDFETDLTDFQFND